MSDDTKFIRVIATGAILSYDNQLAKNPECEVISEQEAFPERFVNQKVLKKAQATRKTRKVNLDLSTEEPKQPKRNVEVAAEVTRRTVA